MIRAAHDILMLLYVALPPLAVVIVQARRAKPNSVNPWAWLLVAAAGSGLLGIGACIVYGLWLDGVVSPGQVFLTWYLAAGLLCLLKLLDLALERITRLVFFVRHGRWLRGDRFMAAHLLRVLMLFAIGLPYMIVAAAVYRPKITRQDDSAWMQLGAARIRFAASDGLELSGLWITPSAPDNSRKAGELWGRQTLILCPGSRDSKLSYLTLATEFLDNGYNVLSFDFRGHGQSEGQMVSFGDAERLDVLGAVRWLRNNYSAQASRIVGIGVDTGGAALIAAASDGSSEGGSIDAITVIGCYDRFDAVATDVTHDHFLPPLRWLVRTIGVPLASLQAGLDLSAFAPADCVDSIAPRPIFFIHRVQDEYVSFQRGQWLFDAASAPKEHLWISETEGRMSPVLPMPGNTPATDPDIARTTRRFFDKAVPML
jgi:fermentation-respiration switch protein FrsA (DUF1100 family)